MLHKEGTLNFLSERYKRRYARQPKEVQQQLDRVDSINWREHQLITLKKSKLAPKDGDLFVFSPRKNIFFMGRVIQEKIVNKNKDVFIDGKTVVFLFRKKGRSKMRDEFEISYDNLLMAPLILDVSYWEKGLFETIGNEPLTQKEKRMDYGFFSVAHRRFQRAEGTIIGYEPPVWGTYGITTITGVASKFMVEAIIDPSLVEG